MEKDEEGYDVAKHHGTCDVCRERNIPVLHLGYSHQKDSWRRTFRVCEGCIDTIKGLDLAMGEKVVL